jgi:hypothetical protein
MKARSHLARHLFVLSHSHITQLSFFSTDFYNYFQHGIDFLISDHTHVVKKIILHSNVVSAFCSSIPRNSSPPAQPGTPLFQRYKRCPWQIEGKPEDDEDGVSQSWTFPDHRKIKFFPIRYATKSQIR